MKAGVKVFARNKDYFEQIREHADFIEVLAEWDIDLDYYEAFDQEYNIHCMHSKFGVNLADPGRNEDNRKALMLALNAADSLNARHVVVHPGMLSGPRCSVRNAIKILKEFSDKRLLIENMPPLDEKSMLGKDAQEVLELMEAAGLGTCLDFGHAACSAYMHETDHVSFIEELMELNPRYFHISDGSLTSLKDLHLPLGQGGLDLEAIKKLLPENAEVTLETPHNLERQKADTSFLKA